MAFTTKSQPLHSALSLLAILQLLFLWPSKGTASEFTAHLIPRDSPLSPFYNPSSTHFSRLHDAFERSMKRVHHFNSSLARSRTIKAPLKPGGGEYLMKTSIGTPPIEMVGIADTGSDLTWTQCLPCDECYNQTLPLFDPHLSSTYHNISCHSSFCNALDSHTCSADKNSSCEYNYSYGDGSFTNGDLATDTLTLGSNHFIRLPKIVFGCGRDNGGLFDPSESGIIGLGGGKLSLISQLGHSIGKKFSYCLVPKSNESSKISFGRDAVVSGSGAVTTPLVAKSPDTYYYLSLEGFSVGNKRIAYKGSSINTILADEGNIIIDSGTLLTFLPPELVHDLESVLDKAINAKRVKDPTSIFSLCYKTNKGKINIPTITAHFKGGDVKLHPLNTFIKVDHDLLCFAMVSMPGIAIYGNLAQINILVGYDLEARTVSFTPTNCAKH